LFGQECFPQLFGGVILVAYPNYNRRGRLLRRIVLGVLVIGNVGKKVLGPESIFRIPFVKVVTGLIFFVWHCCLLPAGYQFVIDRRFRGESAIRAAPD
jgi:hypothetical protein